MELNARTYQNIILTVIAVLLLVLVAQTPSRIGIATSAAAQPVAGTAQFAGAPGQRDALAESALEIAKQIGENAKAIQAVATSIDNVAKSQKQP